MALYYMYTSVLQKSPLSPSFLIIIIIVTRINQDFGDGDGDGDGDDDGNDENNKDEDNEDFYRFANIH